LFETGSVGDAQGYSISRIQRDDPSSQSNHSRVRRKRATWLINLGSNSQLQQRRITMEVKLTNRVTMIKTTSSFMAEKHAVWNTMPRLKAAMTELDAKIVEIDTAAQQHET